MRPERLKKLARHLDSLAVRDRDRIRREQKIETIRRAAAVRLYTLCADFVRDVNIAVTSVTLDMSPTEFSPDAFQESGANVFQINVSGRVIQFVFEGTESLLSTENLRVPYTLEGSIRWFNQDMLDRDEIKDTPLFCCVEGDSGEWRYYDSRTHRSGAIDDEYLAALLEQLV